MGRGPVRVDKRRYERFQAGIEVRFQAGEVQVTARSRDISLGGMFIETSEKLPYGTKVDLEVTLPSLPAPAVIAATVRWSSPDGMGVQFGSLRARETWAINQLSRR
jgi:uncharacterized protein (TIGR02266 family)